MAGPGVGAAGQQGEAASRRAVRWHGRVWGQLLVGAAPAAVPSKVGPGLRVWVIAVMHIVFYLSDCCERSVCQGSNATPSRNYHLIVNMALVKMTSSCFLPGPYSLLVSQNPKPHQGHTAPQPHFGHGGSSRALRCANNRQFTLSSVILLLLCPPEP